MKLFIKIFIALGVLVCVAIGLLLMLVNPNDYKPEIEAQVKQSINRDLHIKGDLGWAFFPQLGFSSGEIELNNLEGFGKPHLVKINEASLGINILPLLSGEISIGKLTLNGFEVTMITNKDGVSNLDNMGAKSNTTESTSTEQANDTEPTSEESGFFDISKTQLAGIDINDTVIEIEDLQSGSYQKITINEIKLGQFALNKETDFSVKTHLQVDDLSADIELTTRLLVNNELDNIKLNDLLLTVLATADALPNGELNSSLKTDVDYALSSQKATLKGLDLNTIITGDNLPNKKVSTQLNADISYQVENQLATIDSLKLLIDELALDGNVSVQTGLITKVRYALTTNEWDLNPYMAASDTPAESDSTADSSATKNTTAQPEVEPDLSFLKGLDIDGTLKMAGVKVDNISIGEINKHLIIKQGKAQIKPLTAQLYQGLLTLNAEVDESNGLNKYNLATNLKDVQLMPLLVDAAELELLSGTTSFNFSGKGQGLTTSKIKQGIVGKGDFSLLDGELYGVNLSQELRILKAKIKGKTIPTDDSIKKTDFASLTGNFNIAKGLVNNEKLLMLSPVMRLDGAGLVHIIKESLDYKLSITPLSKSTDETDYLDLDGITIPLVITGTFTQPEFSIDTDSVLKQQLEQELDQQKEKLKEKADEAIQKHTEKLGTETQDKLKDALKGFF
jgi:AsmA protein